MDEEHKKRYMKEWYEKNKKQIKERRQVHEQRPEIKAKRKEYLLKNKEKRKLTYKKYYIKNRDQLKERMKEYRLKNKEYFKEYNKERRPKNREHIREYRKEYYINNREKLREQKKEYRLKNKEHSKERYNEDINFRIKKLLRSRLLTAMKLYTKTGKLTSSKLMGIHWNLVIKYLTRRMPSDFHERKYHIDHVIPLCKFDLEDPEQIKVAFAPDNHQWLLAENNLSKGGKYEYLCVD